MKKISIVTSCYNEQENLPKLYDQLMKVVNELENKYTYEIIIADNDDTALGETCELSLGGEK